MKKYRIWILVSLIALVAISVLYLRGQGNPRVSVVTVELRDVEASFAASGIVRGRSIELSPRINGIIASVLVEEGQRVSRGDVLLRLDDSDYRAATSEASAAERSARERVNQAQSAREALRQEIDARIETARRMRDAAVAELERVQAGVKPEQIEQAELRVEQAQASLIQATRELDRARRLYAEGAIALSRVEELETRHRIAEAEVTAARKAVDSLRATPTSEEVRSARANVSIQEANLRAAESARSQLSVADSEYRIAVSELDRTRLASNRLNLAASDFEILAPADGIVSRIDLEIGESVTIGVPVIHMAAEGAIYVEIEVSDQDTAKVFTGQEVTVTSGAMPGREYRGVVQSIAPEVELKQDAAVRIRILRASVVVEDPDEFFRVGMELDVFGTGVTTRNSMTVPSDAIYFDDSTPAVWIVENGRVRLQEVAIGYTTFQYTEILDGAKPGDQVVIRGKDGLEHGMAVEVVDD